MLRIHFKKRYEIRQCPKCKTGRMSNIKPLDKKEHNKGLYICNNCSHYYYIGLEKTNIKLWISLILLLIVIMRLTKADWDITPIVILLLWIAALLYDIRKYRRLYQDYPIIKQSIQLPEPNNKQLKGLERYKSNQALGEAVSACGSFIS